MLSIRSENQFRFKGRLAFWMLNILLPLLIGTLIYLFYRPTTLLVFKWLDLIPLLKQVILNSRSTLHYPLGSFIIYSLPTGLWSYSAHVTIFQIWEGNKCISKYLWISAFLFMVYFSEIGQAVGIVSGTFDLKDLVVLIFSTFIAYIATSGRKNEEQKFN